MYYYIKTNNYNENDENYIKNFDCRMKGITIEKLDILKENNGKI